MGNTSLFLRTIIRFSWWWWWRSLWRPPWCCWPPWWMTTMLQAYGQGHAEEDGHEAFKMEYLDQLAPPLSKQFTMPPLGINAKDFVLEHFGPNSDAKNLQFRKGTTTLAFIYEPKTENDLGGIVVAVDSRASAGEYISSKSVMKILSINDRMVATMAGGAADCQFWIRVVAKYCKLFELREKSQISVRAASKYLSNVLYAYRNNNLSVYSMLAGIDSRGPSIYLVQSDGLRLQQRRICSMGSGMLSAYGYLDTHYQPKMTDAEAVELGKRAIMHATFRDAGSGGNCNVAHITSKAKTHYGPFDVSDMYYDFVAESGQDLTHEVQDDS